MFNKFAAAVLLSTQLAISEARRGHRDGSRHQPYEGLMAYCMVEGNPGDANDSDISGLFLFE